MCGAYEAMEVDAMIEKPFNVQALRQALDRLAVTSGPLPPTRHRNQASG